MAIYDRSNEIGTLAAWIVSRIRHFSLSIIASVAVVVIIFQALILNQQIGDAKTSVTDWIEKNRNRLEQALFLRDSLPIESLIAELAASKGPLIESLYVLDKNGVPIFSSGPQPSAKDSPSGFHHDFLNLKVTFHENLRFADLDVGSLFISANYNVKALLLYTTIVLFALFISVVALQYRVNTLLTEVNKRLSSVVKSLAAADRENEEAISGARIAAKVSHDIRSPLSALKVIAHNLSDLPEEKRLLLQAVVKRLEGMSSELLERSKGLFKEHPLENRSEQKLNFSSIALLQELSNEVSLAHGGSKKIKFESNLDSVFDSFFKVNEIEIKRALSNIINNAIESQGTDENSKPVTVTITASSSLENVNIIISDDGQGIHNDILEKLTKEMVTFGKQKGHGFGVYFASKAIKDHGGNIEFQSSTTGTKVYISIPRSPTPSWFLTHIEIKDKQKLVVVDDENFVHRAWDLKLRDRPDIPIKHFYTISEFERWWGSLSEENKAEYYCLVDYDFSGDVSNGFEVIRRIGLTNQVAVITGRGHDPEIISHAEGLKIKILDKTLVSLLPVDFSKPQF